MLNFLKNISHLKTSVSANLQFNDVLKAIVFFLKLFLHLLLLGHCGEREVLLVILAFGVSSYSETPLMKCEAR